MAQVGEPAAPALPPAPPPPKTLAAALVQVKFESGIDIYDVKKNGAVQELPAPGTPHWGAGGVYPAVYVREGGRGETKGLKIKVKWKQTNCSGNASLHGESGDGKIKIDGDFDIVGESGEKEVYCRFSKKPVTVANYGKGVDFSWKVTAGGITATATGAAVLRLFFVDAEPRPIYGSTWPYEKHYLQAIDWATQWAEGKQGEAAVFQALWGKFSYGTFWKGEERAHVPHVTGFSYWPHGDADSLAQRLDQVVQPGYAAANGWSCRGIAHLFMECLALHGLRCREIIPYTPPTAIGFLVHNWEINLAPVPNWWDEPDDHYGGSWVGTPTTPPLYREVRSGLKKKIDPTFAHILPQEPLKIEFRKKSGVPAQGQASPPLWFSNHWIVEYRGKLYDTSYGMEHNTTNITNYGKKALAGWLVDLRPDGAAKSGHLWWVNSEPAAEAFVCHEFPDHILMKGGKAKN